MSWKDQVTAAEGPAQPAWRQAVESPADMPEVTPLPPPMLRASVDLVEPADPSQFSLDDAGRDRLSRALYRTDESLARTRVTPPGSAQQASADLRTARQAGVGPQTVEGDKEFEAKIQADIFGHKLAQFPRLADWAAKSRQHADAIRNEVDNWATVETLFGKFQSEPSAVEARNRALMGAFDPKTRRWSTPPAASDPGLRGAYTESPGWLLAAGQAGAALALHAKQNFKQQWDRLFPPDSDFWEDEKTKKLRQQGEAQAGAREVVDINETRIPGDNHPVVSKINSVARMSPLLAASALHPAAAFGVMYVDSRGRTYDDLVMQGWDPKEAQGMSEVVGFTTATVGTIFGAATKSQFIPFSQYLNLSKIPGARLGSWLTGAVAQNAFGQAAWQFGKNYAANMVMNVSMAGTEIAMKESIESAKANRPFNTSRVVDDMKAAAAAWAETAALSIKPAYDAYREQRVGVKAQAERTSEQAAMDKAAEAVVDHYERNGLAVRSLAEAHKIVAAAAVIQQSDFAKSNPDDARELIRQMIAPGQTQTVWVDPKAVSRLSDSEIAMLGPLDHAMAHVGNLPIDLTDLLMHPKAEELAQHAAGAPDLQTSAQAIRQLREPAPDLGPRTLPDRYRQPEPPTTPEHMAGWANDIVQRQRLGHLGEMARANKQVAERMADEATRAQIAATEQAKNGVDTTEAERLAQFARQRASAATALRDSAEAGLREGAGIVANIEKLTSDVPDKDQLTTARERAWNAGEEWGSAFDALTEAFGAEKRGCAAGDLSDAYHRITSTKRGDGWDLGLLNKLIQTDSNSPGGEQRGPKYKADLSLIELREIHKALDQISKVVDAETNKKLVNASIEIRDFYQTAKQDLSKIPDLPPGQRAAHDTALTVPQRVGQKVERFQANQNNIYTLLQKIGRVGDALYFDKYVAGKARVERMWSQYEPQLRKIHDEMPQVLRDIANDPIRSPDGANDKFGIRKRSDVWHMIMHMGGEGVDVQIAQGLGIKVEALHQWVHDNIAKDPTTAHDVMEKLVTPHQKIFEQVWEDYRDSMRERGLAPPKKVQPSTLYVHGKAYKGGYGGRLQWADVSGNRAMAHPGSLEALLAHDFHAPTTFDGQLIERNPEAAGVPLLGFDQVGASLHKEIYDIGMRPFVEDTHRVFSNPDVRDLIANKMGKAHLDAIYDPNSETDFLHTVARGRVADVHTARVISNTLLTIQGLAAHNIFSLNFRVLSGQLSHLAAAGFRYGHNPIDFTTGALAAMSPDRRAWAHSQSEVLRLRDSDFQSRAENLIQDMTGVGGVHGDTLSQILTSSHLAGPGNVIQGVREKTANLNYMAWRAMDSYLSHAIWEMAYSKHVSMLGHDEAVHRADKSVAEIMPGQDVYDQSAFARDKSMAGFTFLVRNFPSTLFNAAALRWWESRSTGAGGKAAAGFQIVGMLMAAEVLGKALIMQGGPPKDMDAEDSAGWWALNALGAILYPVQLDTPAKAAVHAYAGNAKEVRAEMSKLTPAAISYPTRLLSDVADMQGEDGERAGRAGAEVISFLTKWNMAKIAEQIHQASKADEPGEALRKGMGYRQ